MKLTCAVCGEMFRSVVIDKATALNQVSTGLVKHVQDIHKFEFAALAQRAGECLLLVNSRLILTMLTTLENLDMTDPRDAYIDEVYTKQQEGLAEKLEFDLWEPESENEEENGEGKEEETPQPNI